jgi:formylglycine-generating enzyme required for sulfatase activity
MSGNVWEWTRSLWGKNVIPSSFGYPYDPGDGREDLSAGNDILRVLRGGAYFDVSGFLRCASRYRSNPDDRYWLVGFRVVLSPI